MTVLLTVGNMVPMLLAAMNVLKHAGAKLAIANRRNMILRDEPALRRDDRIESVFLHLRVGTVSTGHGNQRQPAGDNDGQGDADQAAHLNVLGIAVAHAKIHSRGAGGGKEPDDNRDDRQETDDRLGTRRRRVLTGTADIGEEDDRGS